VKKLKEEIILNLLAMSSTDLSIEEVANKTGLHRNTISKYLYGLEKTGLVVQSRIIGKAKMYSV
jgi:DNA-binding IclR family transcriptional regulator